MNETTEPITSHLQSPPLRNEIATQGYRCPWRKAYLRHGVLHDLLVLHIALVADEQLVDTLGGISVNLLKPLLDVVEGVHVGHIIDDANTVGTTVVRRGDGTEAFLASSVPLEKGERSG